MKFISGVLLVVGLGLVFMAGLQIGNVTGYNTAVQEFNQRLKTLNVAQIKLEQPKKPVFQVMPSRYGKRMAIVYED